MPSSQLKYGYTTGTCATAAAKAATMALCQYEFEKNIDIELPEGENVTIPVLYAKKDGEMGEAAIIKDAGDDPDITDKSTIKAMVAFNDCNDVTFIAGEGVGIITKSGLQLPPGEPAINPTPRGMIKKAVRSITDKGLNVTISIPGGQELAKKTFNPRLGIQGGLSILGSTGRVRPFSNPALRDALKCSVDIAAANEVKCLVYVPGHIGEKAARKHFALTDEQVVEVSNEWGFMLDCFAEYKFKKLLAIGHPGKLVKLAAGDWDTHSSRSKNALDFINKSAEKVIGREINETGTTEGFFNEIDEIQRKQLAETFSQMIQTAIAERLNWCRCNIAIVLTDMQGTILGSAGDTEPWK